MDRTDGAGAAEDSRKSGKTLIEKAPPEPFVPRQVSGERVVPARGRAEATTETPGRTATPGLPEEQGLAEEPGPAGAPGSTEIPGFTGIPGLTGTSGATRTRGLLPRQRQAHHGPRRANRTKRPVAPSLPAQRPPTKHERFPAEYALARRAPRRQHLIGMAAAGVSLAVLAAAGVLAYLGLDDDIRASQLPTRVDGLEAVGDDGSTQWERSSSKDVGSTVISRDYAAPSTGRTLRLVAARTDLTGLLELAWAGDQGTAVGEGRCTQLLDPSGQGEPENTPTMLLCWKAEEALSVYGLAVDQDRRPSADRTMAAVQDLWNELSS